MKAEKGKSGPARMRELGHTSSTVWLDARDREAVEAAAAHAGMKLASYIRACAVLLATRGDTIEDPISGRTARSLLSLR